MTKRDLRASDHVHHMPVSLFVSAWFRPGDHSCLKSRERGRGGAGSRGYDLLNLKRLIVLTNRKYIYARHVIR